ncbi:amidohydrolase family protein [Actinocrispum wychmicini]|uniref:Tol biopolymer transport system component n=1 Tax=Actinocrispum wychmicini TaxID=1213861 RepID=A0A4R2JZK6_9PSEU|nr:amidohydrolase family protein [Actinocrispum wychmicini]TCO62739.1 Tol biopolymer transport system component [Actinocrispum wychmicini]
MSTREDQPGLPRRELLRRGGKLAAVGGAARLGSAIAPGEAVADSAADRAVEDAVAVHEGSSIRAVSSPDGQMIAMDALNAIWLVPLDGGPARRLTDDVQDATQPDWSPDGKSLVFQSFRDGVYNLWRIGVDGSAPRQLTRGPGYDLEPRVSPDGKLVAYSSDQGQKDRICLVDPATGQTRVAAEGNHTFTMPSWSPDGTKLVYVVDYSVIEVVELASGNRQQLVTATGETSLYGPQFAPDGKTLGYVRVTGPTAELVVGDKVVSEHEDVSPFAPDWLSDKEIMYTADGRIRRRVLGGEVKDVAFTAVVPLARRRYRRRPTDFTARGPFDVKGIAGPVLSPDGRQVAFRALNSLWLLLIGGRPRKIVADGFFNTDPDWAPDGRSLVYVSDRAGTANLWRYDLATGKSDRLTDLPNAQITPRFSPDGKKIAYQDESGATWVFDLAANTASKVVAAMYQPGRPTWSPDGTMLALAAIRPYSRRSRAGHNQVLIVDLRTNEIRYQPVATDRSIATRGDDGPVWTVDGRYLVFAMESLVWRVPVDRTGKITGPPRQLTDEVSDSVSVSADGKTVLYLSNGALRTVDIDGGHGCTVPVNLTWRPVSSPDRVVIRAGAIWDGTSAELRRHVDLVVQDGRIAAALPRAGNIAGHVIDASGLTVMPGLIDTHNHWHLRGRQWGDRSGRLWLAYGVTTSRSPGDPAYQMVETRESLAAGARVGPRYLGTGEALDGTRAYYNFMRPVFTFEQLQRELDRARGLDYDLVKAYMRMPVSFEQHVVRWAHDRGIPVTSHYLYPAAHTGHDGQEHTGGGNRLGYSRTLSFAAGKTASDSVAILAASGMWISTTTLFASEMFIGDRSLLDDERTKVLFPDWEYQRLLQKAADADGGPGSDINHAYTVGDVDMLLRVHRAGGLVVIGTDAALDDIGISLHQNLRAMVKYGFTPREALVTATGNAAKCLGLDDQIGSIAVGKLADLAFVEGNPLQDIHAAAAVRTVMVGGRPTTVPELLAPFRAAAAATTTGTRLNPAARAAGTDDYYWHEPEWAHNGCCRAR